MIMPPCPLPPPLQQSREGREYGPPTNDRPLPRHEHALFQGGCSSEWMRKRKEATPCLASPRLVLRH